MLILNLGAGKIKPIFDTSEKETFFTLVNLDTNYFSAATPEEIEDYVENKMPFQVERYDELYCNCDAFEFMEKFRPQFDRICAYRFLEHIPFTKVLYFIYLISTCIRKNSLVDIIVPNYRTLANMLLSENVSDSKFPEDDILLTTELLNEPSCPHASIWTPARAEYFWHLENRFEVESIDPKYEFDGRDIYMRFLARRI